MVHRGRVLPEVGTGNGGEAEIEAIIEVPEGVTSRSRHSLTLSTSSDAPTITPSMLDLCSAPCKARRFAPPAHARGLRALTVPARRSRLGHYVMVGSLMTLSWTDLDR